MGQRQTSSREDVLRLMKERRSEMSRFGVREIGIFGSFARGDQRADSDVDVLVDLERQTYDDYVELLGYLEDLFGRKVDPLMKITIKQVIRNRVLSETVYV